MPEKAGLHPGLLCMQALDADGRHNITRINPKTGFTKGRCFPPGSWDAIAAYINVWNGVENLYFSCNEPRPDAPDGKLSKAQIENVRAVFIDVDPRDGFALSDERNRLHKLADDLLAGPVPPSIVIDSGSGVQMVWKLETKLPVSGSEDHPHLKAAEAQGAGIAAVIGGDATQNIDRILRVPGTINLPNEVKLRKGRVKAQAKLLGVTDALYTIDALAKHFEPRANLRKSANREGAVAAAQSELHLASAFQAVRYDDLDPELREKFEDARRANTKLERLWETGEHDGSDLSGSGRRFALASRLRRDGRFDVNDFASLLWIWDHAVQPGDDPEAKLTEREITRCWGNTEPAPPRAAVDPAQVFEGSSSDLDGDVTPRQRPLITIRQGDLASIATEAEAALVNAGAELYTRGGAIVRPVVEDLPAARGRTATVSRTVKVSKESLTDHLARVADWEKFDGRSKKMVRADPTKQIAEIILSRDGEWKLPKLAGVITTPTLRPDLSMLSEPGYDAATGLLLCRPPKMPEIPLKPTRAQAQEALSLLQSLVRGFTFVAEADKSVALSMLMTPVVRGAMGCAPLHAVRAPSPGSGKSYLTDLAAAISTGQPCPVITPHPDEKELEKRLGAALLYGQSLVSIDNLNGALSGDALCQIVERPLVQVRPLGVSELVRIENKHTVFATGNNLHLLGDIVRRTVVCTIDTGLERPEKREFNDKPFDAVLADRGKYVAAVLTIVLAYKAAGFPGQRRDMASFDEWSKIVRSPLIWLGCADPVATTETARAEDPVLASMTAVMGAWLSAVGVDVPLSAGGLKERADADPALRAALMSVAGDRAVIDARRLGAWLGKYKGRIVSGLKFVSEEDRHAKQKVWVLKSAGSAGISGYVSNLTWGTVRLEDANIMIDDSYIEGVENLPADTRTTRKDILSGPIGVFS
ncbi:hypothetical protein [Mesorhizobium sp. SP-1A]|uniref:hypothetical protein n=1 Tax=Mesorhizobium sp. SP-1A TaxID=3077840 RepID=UPI0028F72B57|nr:hypothetical protein [Mesorhizobium sp. SP-1A]